MNLLKRINEDYINPIGAGCQKFAGFIVALNFLIGILIGLFG